MTARGVAPARAAAEVFHMVLCQSCMSSGMAPCTEFARYNKSAKAALAATTPEAVAEIAHDATCSECISDECHFNRAPRNRDWHITYTKGSPAGRALWWINPNSNTAITPGATLEWLREVAAKVRGRNDVPIGVPDVEAA